MSDLILPLNQSEAFQRTCEKLGLNVRRFEHGSASCLVQSRKLPIIGSFHLLSRGPIGQRSEDVAELVRQVRNQVRGPLVINTPDADNRPGGLKIAVGVELAVAELTDPELMRKRLHQKWRNQLKKAERAPLTVIDQPLDAARHRWFLEAEAAQQKSRKYRSYPASFLLAYAAANTGQARLYTALDGSDPIAAMLVLKHGKMATYQAGFTSAVGRRHCAHNRLLWQIMVDLQRRGLVKFDLGRADLNPGLRRFKLGSGARVEKLGGTYISHSWFAQHNQKKYLPTPVSG